jgi:hypothetical protein
VQPHLHRRLGQVEHLRDLAGRKLLEIPQDDDQPMVATHGPTPLKPAMFEIKSRIASTHLKMILMPVRLSEVY